MPLASGGNIISSSGQVVTGAITSDDILDDTIVNADINSAAAIAMSKLNLAITNTEVAAGAAIVDSKLAQITTASKVSGAALTSLASIPSAAGVIPGANLTASSLLSKGGLATVDDGTANEVNVLSVTVPGGTLGTAKGVRCKVYVDIFRIDTAGQSCVVRFKYGAFTFASFTVTSTTGGTSHTGVLEGVVVGNGATNAQEGWALLNLAVANLDMTAVASSRIMADTSDNTGAIDSTADQSFVVSIDFSNAVAADIFSVRGWTLEILK